jgi:uncharacterized protein YdbL (DUF1318 family)
MRVFRKTGISIVVLGLCACVTVNVYFPAAAAEEAADQIIDDVWGKGAPAGPVGEPNVDESVLRTDTRLLLASTVLAWIVTDAEAAKPNLNVNTPEITAIQKSMEKRFRQLRGFYDSGAIGLSNDGFVLARDLASISARARKDLNRLVNDENRDRKALYREIAVANGQPSWEAEIQKTFAKRWVANARSGWWSQNAKGQWAQRK